jgi:hypothetical protein
MAKYGSSPDSRVTGEKSTFFDEDLRAALQSDPNDAHGPAPLLLLLLSLQQKCLR